jgi:hypothetical protein
MKKLGDFIFQNIYIIISLFIILNNIFSMKIIKNLRGELEITFKRGQVKKNNLTILFFKIQRINRPGIS